MNRASGFSLVELMVGLAIGSILIIAAIAAFMAVSNTSDATQKLATLEENAVFALETMVRDIRNAGTRHCMNFAGAAPVNQNPKGDKIGGLWSHFDATGSDLRLGPLPSSQPYLIDASWFIRGSDCGGGVCSSLATAVPSPFAPPDQGTNEGERLALSDALALRSLRGPGVMIDSVDSPGADGVPAAFQFHGLAADVPLASSDVAVVADCGGSSLVRVAVQGNRAELAGNFDDDRFRALQLAGQAAIHPGSDLVPVSYYLALSATADHPDSQERTGNLIRREGTNSQVIARGIERLDFRYHLETANGSSVVLDADEVDTWTDCRVSESPAAGAGCGWASLLGVEIHLLASTAENVRAQSEAPAAYPFDDSGNFDGDASPRNLHDATIAQGMTPGRRLRRHLSAFAATRGFNP